MNRFHPGLHKLLYYGEAVGVLVAWLVGVAAVLSAGGTPEPVAQTPHYADVSLSDKATED